MDAALNVGARYVDLASDDPLEQLKLKRRWEQAGLTAVITQGGPFVTNAFVASVADIFDRVDEIRLRHGWRRLGEEQRLPSWSHSWSPEVALSEWESEPVVYKDGEYERRPTFSGMEEYGFPDPVGPLTLCLVDYEPVYTLPHFISVGYVDCKIPPDLVAGTLIKMGLASREPVEVKGLKVIPREVLMALTPQPADQDSPATNSDVLLCYLAEVAGEKNCEKEAHLVYRSSSASQNLAKYGVRWADVAVPAVVTTLMLAEGEVEPGVFPPEGLPPLFLKRLAEWAFTFEHTVVRSASPT
jgi:saccharopine dehydrogenase (NAD+, L-lysine-forming)